jgi:hypothetical protein
MSSPDPKLRQTAKLKALREALIEAGFWSLDAQSAALGLGRSTTWVILRGQHKSSGLSAGIINRMLAAPDLPPSVRAVVLDYVREKLAGVYGHKGFRLKVFASRLPPDWRAPSATRGQAGRVASRGEHHQAGKRRKLAFDEQSARQRHHPLPGYRRQTNRQQMD